MKDIVAKIRISPEVSIKQALKKIDEAGMAILFVCDSNGILLGSLTDGDIRRRILETGNLQDKIINCFNRTPVYSIRVEDLRNVESTKMSYKLLPDSGIPLKDILTE